MSELTFEQSIEPVIGALSNYLEHYFSPGFLSQSPCFSVGFSAGEDSSVLLLGLAHLSSQYGYRLHAVHVHHGLMVDANEWVEQAKRLCEILKIPCSVLYVQVDPFLEQKKGLEAAARVARYEALEKWFEQQGIEHHFLAHHQKDQLETVLFRLFRGSGPHGLQGMNRTVLNRQGVRYERPLLTVSKAQIHHAMQSFSKKLQWQSVEDPSNHDLHYARAKFRHQIMPLLDRILPAWSGNLLRFSELMQEQQTYLDALMKSKLNEISTPQGIDLSRWRRLPLFEQKGVLRAFLQAHHLAMPSQSRLNEWVRQFQTVHQQGTDRHVRHEHDGVVIEISKGVILVRGDMSDERMPNGHEA